MSLKRDGGNRAFMAMRDGLDCILRIITRTLTPLASKDCSQGVRRIRHCGVYRNINLTETWLAPIVGSSASPML